MAAVSEQAKQNAREGAKRYRAENKEKVREINRRNGKARSARYRENHPEKIRQIQAEYYQQNKDDILAYLKNYRETSDAHKIANARWADANKHIKRASNAKRRARIRRATAVWADDHVIAEIYAEAERLTKSTGVQHVWITYFH